MIYRTYGRRGRGITRSYSGANSFGNGVLDSSSQDCSQDVYDFTFPSQESTGCLWSDPYSFDSSEESRQLAFLPPRDGRDYEGGGRKSKKPKVIDLDSEPYGSSSCQESKEIEILEFSEFHESRKSKHGSDSHILSSSRELADLGIPLPKKGNGACLQHGFKRKSKKPDREQNEVLQRKRKKKKIKQEPGYAYEELTTTLMETQEGGEMMEHLDEVNFALDGLKKGQPVRVRRASLLSLLLSCGTIQQRRLLRVHRLEKSITDAILGLNFDDSPSNLAAAALCYILTCDGQDDNHLASAAWIRFLVNLLNLKPLMPGSVKDKAQPISSKLIGLCKNADFLQESAKGMDSSSYAIMLKVRDILISSKEIKPRTGDDGVNEEPELNPKWISLLIMEKACLSNISIEETSGTLRKSGGNFKEKLREFGGLEAVFEVARKCLSVMEEYLEKSLSLPLDSKDIFLVESLVVLLKCLKIMENATFLSKDNQRHLLGMKGNFDGQKAPRSFVKLVLRVIKIISGMSLLRGSLASSVDVKLTSASDGNTCSGECSMEWASQNNSSISDCKQSQLSADFQIIKLSVESSQTGSCSGASHNLKDFIIFDSEKQPRERQLTSTNIRIRNGGHDPFAFDEDDLEPSKWDLLSEGVTKSLSEDSRGNVNGYTDVHSGLISSKLEPNMEYFHSQEASSSVASEDKSSLPGDLLLTAVKVLMNLSNDNIEGCQQVANSGGLEILCSLIAVNFPLFTSSTPPFDHETFGALRSKSSPWGYQQSNTHLTDQEIDFLVAILGSLVNLVEKDLQNRSRLAKATVSLPELEGLDLLEDQRDVISLLCSIFLANQDASSEATREDFSLEDEESLLQGEREAEKMIVEAYAALLLAFLSTESNNVRTSIAESLPDHNLRILVPVLERFVEFHRTLDMISQETHSAVLEVIESCRIP